MKFELFKQGVGAEVLELDINRKASDADIAEQLNLVRSRSLSKPEALDCR